MIDIENLTKHYGPTVAVADPPELPAARSMRHWICR